MPNLAKDLIGEQFGLLTVIERAENASNGNARWKCRCQCGNEVIAVGSHLKAGSVKSCGCLPTSGRLKHGGSNTVLYKKWKSMIRRCEDPSRPCYHNYGGRGIKVCPEWHDFTNFREWFNQTCNDSNLTLDRIDVNGDYCPENCRWVDYITQNRNRRNNIKYEMNGEYRTLGEWCELLNLSYPAIYRRIHVTHWSFGKAISTPIRTSA